MQWAFYNRNEPEKKAKSLIRFSAMSKYIFSLVPRKSRGGGDRVERAKPTSGNGSNSLFSTSRNYNNNNSNLGEHKESSLPGVRTGRNSIAPTSNSTLSSNITLPDIPRSLSARKNSHSGSRVVGVAPEESNHHRNSHEEVVPIKQGAIMPAKATSGKPGKLCCDKCDGNHETDNCPHYKKNREKHPDGQKNFYKKIGGTSTLPGAEIRNARIVRQPGDGSCLFHSMSYGLCDGSTAASLRSEICSFIKHNPHFKICDTPLSDWVQWDSGSSCAEYARMMSRGAWGGGIEMACLAQIKNSNVHVYEHTSYGFKRISAFDYPESPESKKTVRVLYRGGVHYGELFYCRYMICIVKK